MPKPFVYVAGPYTNPDPVTNTRRAIEIGTMLIRDGVVTPFIPHLSLLADIVCPMNYETWLDYDLDVISNCDALLRLSGESSGADKEVAFALELGLPVFFNLRALYGNFGAVWPAITETKQYA